MPEIVFQSPFLGVLLCFMKYALRVVVERFLFQSPFLGFFFTSILNPLLKKMVYIHTSYFLPNNSNNQHQKLYTYFVNIIHGNFSLQHKNTKGS